MGSNHKAGWEKNQTKLCFTRKSTELLNIRQLECAPISLESAPLFQGTVKGKKKSISNHGRKKILIDHL